MQTSDSAGNGFAQQRGYFEIRCRMPLPGTKGAWPAFWLYSRALYTQPSQTRAEIDIIEYYPGNDPRGHHSSVHLRPGVPYIDGEVSQHWSDSDYTTVDLAGGRQLAHLRVRGHGKRYHRLLRPGRTEAHPDGG